MKKPDRFERMAEKACMDWVNGEQVEGWQSVSVKLLRKEHRWVERMVKAHDLPYDEYVNADYQRGYLECVNTILEQLKQRRK